MQLMGCLDSRMRPLICMNPIETSLKRTQEWYIHEHTTMKLMVGILQQAQEWMSIPHEHAIMKLMVDLNRLEIEWAC